MQHLAFANFANRRCFLALIIFARVKSPLCVEIRTLHMSDPSDSLKDGVAFRTLHLTDPLDTLKEELDVFPEMALGFENPGHVNHYYHLMMNAALPLYAKLVRPFALVGAVPLRRTLYVNSMGGTIELLAEVFPEFEFVFVPWVPRCYPKTCADLGWSIRSKVHVHWSVLDSDDITRGGKQAYKLLGAEYRQLVWDFRGHILERAQVGQGPLKHVYVSRRDGNTFESSGCERRCLEWQNERELVQALNATAAGVRVLRLFGMSWMSQVQAHQEASVVIGVHGAGFANCLWMPHNSSIIEINNHPKPPFRWLCNEILRLHRRFYQARGKDTAMWVNLSEFMSEHEDVLR